MRARSCWIAAMGCALVALPAAASQGSVPPDYLPDHPTEGYPVPDRVVQGETVRFHIHSLEPYVLKVWREGLTPILVHTSGELPATTPARFPYAWLNGAGWPSSYDLAVPSDWPSGPYFVEIIPTTLENQRHLSFYVTPADPGSTSSMVVLVPTNTWQAYNYWGGKSIYKSKVIGDTSVSTQVHYERPFETFPLSARPLGVSGHYRYPDMFLDWLDAQGLTAEFVTDRDFHADPTLLDPYRLAVVVAVGEYYTREMFDAVERVRDRGGSLLFLGSTNIHWAARLEQNDKKFVTWKVQCKKDPVYKEDPSLGTCHWTTDEMGRSSASLTGVRYVPGSPSVAWSPCRVVDPDHWMFAGTGLVAGDLIGDWSCGGELDATVPDSPPILEIPIATMVPHKHLPETLYPQETVYYEHRSAYDFPDGQGGRVWTAGAEFWVFDLDDDPDISAITRNLLETLARPARSQDCDPTRMGIDGAPERCEPPGPAQTKCAEALNRGLVRVVKAEGRSVRRCLKKAARGGEAASVCLGQPPRGVQRERERLARAERHRCAAGPAPLGPADAKGVSAATDPGALEGVLADLLGSDLDATLAAASDDSDTARCQLDVARAGQRCLDARVRAFYRCAKAGLGDGSVGLPSELEACRRGDPDGKITRACSEKPGEKIERRCTARSVDLAAAFPGCGAGAGDELLACLEVSVECRACRLLGDAAQLPGVCESCPAD